jgi:hypothetical protein
VPAPIAAAPIIAAVVPSILVSSEEIVYNSECPNNNAHALSINAISHTEGLATVIAT